MFFILDITIIKTISSIKNWLIICFNNKKSGYTHIYSLRKHKVLAALSFYTSFSSNNLFSILPKLKTTTRCSILICIFFFFHIIIIDYFFYIIHRTQGCLKFNSFFTFCFLNPCFDMFDYNI